MGSETYTIEDILNDSKELGVSIIGYVKKLAENIHYPECWDTMAYPTLWHAYHEIAMCNPDHCSHNGDGYAEDNGSASRTT